MPLVIKSTRHQDNSAPPRQRIPMSVSNPTCSRQCCQCWICPFLGPTYLDFHKSTPKESKKYSLYRFPQRCTLHLGMKQCPIESPHSAMVVREWACVIRLDACVRLIRRNIIYICSIWALVKGRDPPTVPELYPTCTADQMESPTLCSQRLIFGDFQHDQSVNRNSHATLIILSEIHQTCQCSGLSSSSKYEELPCFGFSKNRISDSIH